MATKVRKPTFLSPQISSIDLSETQIFTSILDSTITDYQLIVRKLSDNSILYNSNKIHLTTPKYDNEILEITINGATIITSEIELKWSIQVWNGVDTITSDEVMFYNLSNPTLALNITEDQVLTSRSYEFVGDYSQSEGVAVKNFKFILYSSNDLILESTDVNYSENVRYKFEGFISDNIYKVECIVENDNGVVITTGKISFSVSYSAPNVDLVPRVTLDKSTSAMIIEWGKAVAYLPTISEGATTTYIEDFTSGYTVNNYGLKIENGSLTYTVDIPKDFTLIYNIKFLSTFTSGVFLQLAGENGELYKIGYEGTKFYYDNHGAYQSSKLEVLNHYQPYTVVVRPTDILINITDIYGKVSNLARFTLNQLSTFTIDDLANI
jgi:hypothetical protein